ncbi:uncharacterized protein LOC119682609 [Teleopsis dalmanni]|uniref:uncharacterized protein LOC119682609 n=1 Tax=Teleopsis dalmanni TaxID=139649 RepID=UPI0018CE5E14|nr:uncharacterized protein LOC119682609 [Teleopsis dalmanni]
MSVQVNDLPPSYDEATGSSLIDNTKSGSNLDANAKDTTFNSVVKPTAPSPIINSYGALETTPVSVEDPSDGEADTLPIPRIAIGDCPACRVGQLEDGYSCLGLVCAIVLFPIGIICCMAMKNKRCPSCGTEF